MSKERARRRALRQAEAERLRAARAWAVARRQRRQELLRRLRPRRTERRTGRIFARRSRGQRSTIVVSTLVALAAIWLFVADPALRLVLTLVLLLGLPAVVVIALGRRI
ncbi:MAG TPA: hypothetical protein VFX61_11520 [Micromonosporaceae bacterium]|nr:hypothetical protein [Micromonosporaceae bacterium]